jgi:transposase
MRNRKRMSEQIKNLDRKGMSHRIKSNRLTPEDQRILLLFVRIVPALLETLHKKRRQLGGLLTLLWGKKSESARDILKDIEKENEKDANKAKGESAGAKPEPQADSSAASSASSQAAIPKPSQSEGVSTPDSVVPLKPKRNYKKDRKNGSKGANEDDYPNAEVQECHHPTLKPGDTCTKCGVGKLYLLKQRVGRFIQFIGSPFLNAKLYFQDILRCSACEATFPAPLPDGASGPRGTTTASAMVALLKYGAGFPFYRMSTLQRYLKTPISPSGLWTMLESLIEVALIVFQEMRRQAAQGEVIHNDDTMNKIMEFIRAFKKQEPGKKGKKQRKKIFTSGILSNVGSVRIVLFFTGLKNAGENLEDLLMEREQELGIPIQMSDASTMNKPGKQKTKEGACLTHGRRGFIKSYKGAKKAVAYVIGKLREVYLIDREAKRLKLSPDGRLKLHQEKSAPIMEELKRWMDDQIVNKKVEENSALGDAIQYCLNHWEKLTLFLRVPGAPLTNDELEQKFKMVKMHLKNSLFYKTPWGALVGDLFMSIIHTCVLAKEDPFDYLVAIQEHRDEVSERPGDWMPWNYRKALPVATDAQKAA